MIQSIPSKMISPSSVGTFKTITETTTFWSWAADTGGEEGEVIYYYICIVLFNYFFKVGIILRF